MKLIGIYHRVPYIDLREMGDMPCVAKGKNALLAQECASEGGLLACVVGRIRNARALAMELGVSSSDGAEIVLAAYRRWGEGYPEKIEGNALSVLMDCEEDLLILARDRMGEQPLFYCALNGYIAFSDHPDALIEAGACRPVVDAQGLNELFALGPARTPGRTPYRDMAELEPGTALVVRNGKSQKQIYFHLEAREHTHDARKTVETVRGLLEQAMEEICACKPACMLSGGLDSTTLAALLTRKIGKIESFSVDYEGNAQHFQQTAFQPSRDAPYIEMAAEALGTNHRQIMLSQQELADNLEAAVDARGFPGMADVDSSMLLFARQIAPHARAALSGECADEVFGGYPWFRDASFMHEDQFPWSGSMALREGILRREVACELKPAEFVRDTLRSAVNAVEHLPGEAAEEKCLRTMQVLCFQFFMANLQERARQMCLYANLEVLTPFCDDRLVLYVYNVPWKMKFTGGREKGLLREAVKDLLPEALAQRKKSPYPKTCNPVYAQIVRRMTTRMLEDSESPILRLVDDGALRALLESDLAPTKTPWYGQLMAGPQMLAYLLQINQWLKARKVEIIL